MSNTIRPAQKCLVGVSVYQQNKKIIFFAVVIVGCYWLKRLQVLVEHMPHADQTQVTSRCRRYVCLLPMYSSIEWRITCGYSIRWMRCVLFYLFSFRLFKMCWYNCYSSLYSLISHLTLNGAHRNMKQLLFNKNILTRFCNTKMNNNETIN